MPHCPLCASELVWKKAAGGGYLGCPNYPECAKPIFNLRTRKSQSSQTVMPHGSQVPSFDPAQLELY
jgi:ssDNA-binding Zn-finger/Zn-ribbon topoisomerase 1